jgi:pimeloyl-ACP methyl ester carboxylesterase
MNVDTFGDGADLMWVMGWGNTVESRHERWFVDRLVEAGYRVHVVELPTNGTDFQRDYLDPVRDSLADLDDPLVTAHSMGGLVTAHLQPDGPVVYLSPWWGLGDDPGLLESVLFRLPTSRTVLPTPVAPAALGGLADERDVTAPDGLSPAWIRTMAAAQDDLPALDEDDVVFYAPDDQVVSPTAIERHADGSQLESYDGGHELFASEGREDHVERVLAALPDD